MDDESDTMQPKEAAEEYSETKETKVAPRHKSVVWYEPSSDEDDDALSGDSAMTRVALSSEPIVLCLLGTGPRAVAYNAGVVYGLVRAQAIHRVRRIYTEGVNGVLGAALLRLRSRMVSDALSDDELLDIVYTPLATLLNDTLDSRSFAAWLRKHLGLDAPREDDDGDDDSVRLTAIGHSDSEELVPVVTTDWEIADVLRVACGDAVDTGRVVQNAWDVLATECTPVSMMGHANSVLLSACASVKWRDVLQTVRFAIKDQRSPYASLGPSFANFVSVFVNEMEDAPQNNLVVMDWWEDMCTPTKRGLWTTYFDRECAFLDSLRILTTQGNGHTQQCQARFNAAYARILLWLHQSFSRTTRRQRGAKSVIVDEVVDDRRDPLNVTHDVRADAHTVVGEVMLWIPTTLVRLPAPCTVPLLRSDRSAPKTPESEKVKSKGWWPCGWLRRASNA